MRCTNRAAVTAVFLAAVAASPTLWEGSAQAPRDVKGWRGAEWGMTPEQVAAAIQLPLENPTRSRLDKAIWSYTTRDVTLGGSTARAELFFRQSRGSRQLAAVELWFPERQTGGRSVCDELTSTYGTPTSLAKGQVQVRELWRQVDLSIWELGSTRVTCQRITLPPDKEAVRLSINRNSNARF